MPGQGLEERCRGVPALPLLRLQHRVQAGRLCLHREPAGRPALLHLLHNRVKAEQAGQPDGGDPLVLPHHRGPRDRLQLSDQGPVHGARGGGNSRPAGQVAGAFH